MSRSPLTPCPLRLRPRPFPRFHPAALLLLAAAATCGGASTDGPAGPSAISLSSDAAIVLVGQVVNISVTGGTTGLIWSVNGVVGGDTIVVRIDQAGHYTAPLLAPSGNPVHISAARSDGTGNASVSVGV